METFLRWASPHPRRPDCVFDASFRPNTPPDAASETDDPRPRLPLPRRPRRSDLGLREYYPRFAAQGVETADDLPANARSTIFSRRSAWTATPGASTRRRADFLHLTKTRAPIHSRSLPRSRSLPPPFLPRIISHARKLKDALLARGGGARPRAPPRRLPAAFERSPRRKTQGGRRAAAADPAGAIRAAMAAARARGGGRRPPRSSTHHHHHTHPPSPPRTVSTSPPPPNSRPSWTTTVAAMSSPSSVSAGAVDLHGKVDWSTHPVSRMGEVAMRAKVMALRADPVRCRHRSPPAPVAAVDARPVPR